MRRALAIGLMMILVPGCDDDNEKTDARPDGAISDVGTHDMSITVDQRQADGPAADLVAHDVGAGDTGTAADGAGIHDMGAVADAAVTTDTGVAADAAVTADTGVAADAAGTADTGVAADAASGLIGPAGGTVTSVDGKAQLYVPAGALASPVTFAVVPAAGTPSGNIGPAYDFGPSGTTFAVHAQITITYDPASLGGATESSLRLATVVNGAWQIVAGAKVDTTNHQVRAEVDHLSPYGVLEGTIGANVVFVHAMGSTTPYVGAAGSSIPLIAVAIDANNVPIRNAVLTYSVDKESVAHYDPSTGMVQGGTLTSAGVPEDVVITAHSGTATATQTVHVYPRTKSMVTLSSSMPINVLGQPGAEPLVGAEITSLRNPESLVLTNASGQFSGFPQVESGSFYTFKFRASGYLDGYLSGMAPLDDGSYNPASVWLITSSISTTTLCTKTIDAGLGILVVNETGADRSGWSFYISDPGASLSYVASDGGNACDATATSTMGQGNFINVAPGWGWIVAKKGSTIKGTVYHIGPGGSYSMVGLLP